MLARHGVHALDLGVHPLQLWRVRRFGHDELSRSGWPAITVCGRIRR
jgi:hypothetical protein